MKHLQDYIIEQAQVNEGANSKSITFNFKDLENGKETLDSLKDKEGVTIDEEAETLTVEVTADNVNKLDAVQDILQQFCHTIRNSSKRSSDEQYAQKTVSFEKKVGELNDAIDEIANPEDNKNEDDNDNDDKNDEK
jgi:uncharacterized protein YukE